MASIIQFISAASANATSVAISTPNVGDLILVEAYDNAAATVPSVPAGAGWTVIQNNTTTLLGGVQAYKISNGTETTTGVFTNATNIVAKVYRNTAGPGGKATGIGNSATITYPAVTLQQGNGTSWVSAGACEKGATAGMNGTTTNLTSNRTNVTTANGLDTNAGVASFASSTLTATTSGRFIAFCVELLQANPLDDGSQDYWGSQLASTVARGCLALALATGLSQAMIAAELVDDPGLNSELPIPQSLSADGMQTPVVVQNLETGVVYTYHPDEWPTPVAVVFQPDEDYWPNAPNQSLPPPLQGAQQAEFARDGNEDFPIPNSLSADGLQVPTISSPEAAVAYSFHPDDLPLLQAEEEYWQNPTAPVSGRLYQQLPYLPDPEEIPAGKLFGQDDEDFWVNPIAPVPFVLLWPQPFTWEQNESPAAFEPDEDYPFVAAFWPSQIVYPQQFSFEQSDLPVLNTDEDFWSHQVQYTEYRPVFYSGTSEVFFAPFLEEEYWINPVAPVQLGFLCPQQWAFDTEEFVTMFDEDFWVNPIAPVPLRLYQQLPYQPDLEEPTAVLSGQPDEDYWQNPVAPIAGKLVWPQPWIFDQDEQATGLYGQADEDFWANAVAPVPFVLLWPQPFSFDQPDLPILGTDEDFWVNPVAPAPFALQWPQQWTFEQNESAVQFQPDEDYPFTSTLWSIVPVYPQQFVFEQSDLPILNTDEDFWVNPVAPIVGVLLWPQQWSFDTEEFVTTFDEDYWQNPVAPVPGRLYQQLPYQPDVEEPTAVLSGQPDEDYWQNPTPPIVGKLLWPQPYLFEQNEQAFGLYGQADEDFWINPVAPVSGSLLWPQPYSFDQPDLPILGTDEDFWQNPTPPVASSLLWPQQWIFDQDEQAVLEGQPDEDYWVSGVAPVPLRLGLLQQWPFDQNEPTLFQPDEDYAVSQSLWSIPTLWPQQWTFDTEEFVTMFDEDFWQNPVAPTPLLMGRLYLPDPEELPAATLSGQPDEDYWVNPVAPVPFTLGLLQQWPFDQDEQAVLEGQPDEDYWQNPTPPVPGKLTWPQPFTWEQNEQATGLFGQPDEDYWQNSVAPVVGVLLWPQQWIFDTEEFVTTFDEDYWQNPVAPIQLIFEWPQQFTFDVAENATGLYGQPDEDFWVNPVAPVAKYPVPLFFTDDEIIVPQPQFINTDEDFWVNPVAPKQLTFGSLYLPDPEEIPAGKLTTQVDEDYWQQPRAIQVATNVAPQQAAFEQNDFVSTFDEDYWLYLPKQAIAVPPIVAISDDDIFVSTFDEDYWLNLPKQVIALPSVAAFSDDDIFVSTFDEDYWINSVVPTQLRFIPLFVRDDDAAPQQLGTDEDFWVNPVAPVVGTLAYPQPFVFDQDEQAMLEGQPDEDYWQNSVASVPARLYQQLPYQPDLEEPTAVLHGQPDEDFWVNPIAPVQATLYQRLPYQPDIEESIFQGPPEEDFWINSVRPVVGSMGRLYLPDPEEISAGNLSGQPDEDFWVNSVRPSILTMTVPQQASFDVQEMVPQPVQDEDFWVNPVAPKQGTLGPLYQPDPEEIPAATLSGQPDEDYWVNPVAPVAKYPVPIIITDDDVIAFRFVTEFDEDYWQNWVAPVPLSFNSLYQPDPEEIPAGHLVAPIITKISDSLVVYKQLVYIYGFNFGETQGTSQVLWNGVPSVVILMWTPQLLFVEVPPGSTTGLLVVQTASTVSNPVPFVKAVDREPNEPPPSAPPSGAVIAYPPDWTLKFE